MSTLIIDHRAVRLDYEQQCLIIRQPDLPPRSVPLQGLQRIVCLHGVQLSSTVWGSASVTRWTSSRSTAGTAN